jgi:D-alanyl-D-alanine dipeptidase
MVASLTLLTVGCQSPDQEPIDQPSISTPSPGSTPTVSTPSPLPTLIEVPEPPRCDEDGLPAGFVCVNSVDPSIAVQLRYATTNNFTGAVVDGYESVTAAIVLSDTATALARVQADLKQEGFGLLILDAYRPTRAVANFVEWSKNSDTSTKQEYYPNLAKTDLFRLGYIAEHSNHSLGTAVDVTLIDLATGEVLDMGSEFDLFDTRSHYQASGLTSTQSANRTRLRQAMVNQGFTPYSNEWWHFDYTNARTQGAQNFPVR